MTDILTEKKHLILLVDDIPSNLHVLASALRSEYRIKMTTNGASALELARKEDRPDLILLDVMMPEMSGHDVLLALRAEDYTRDIPVIFVTADTSQHSELTGLELGVDDYVTKPVIVPVLLARVRNLLQRRQMELALRQSEKNYASLTEAAPVGIFRLEANGQCNYVNPIWVELTGLEPEDALGEGWKMAIHPEDQTVIHAIEHILKTGEPFKEEFRILSPKRMAWVFCKVVATWDEQGHLSGVVGTLNDINQRKQAEQALKERELHLRTLIESMSDVLFVIDTAGYFTEFHWPPAIQGCSKDQGDPHFIGHRYAECLPDETAQAITHAIATLLTTNRPHSEEIVLLRGEKSFPFHATFSIIPDSEQEGWPKGFLCVARDMSERKSLEERLMQLATTDSLTGLSNRRAFMDQMDSALKRMKQDSLPAYLMMMDLDHFKRINDHYGHAGGDAALCHFSRLLKTHLGERAVAGRIGGEEFALLFWKADAAAAVEEAQTICAQLAHSELAFREQVIHLTVSIGLTAFLPEDTCSDEILNRADGALYRAKESGRNRVEEA